MEEQDRLIDYVAICTLKGPSLKRRVSPVKNSNDASDYADMKLKVHSRFPEEDWEDAAFPRALPLFCLPSLDGLEHVYVADASISQDSQNNQFDVKRRAALMERV